MLASSMRPFFELGTLTVNLRRTLLGLSLCLLSISMIPIGSGLSEPGQYSRPFLENVNEACWFELAMPQRRGQPARALVRLYLHNPSAFDLFQVCVYDLTCGEVVFSGRFPQRSRKSIPVCSDSRNQGHILLLDTLGHVFEHRNLKSPSTIKLWTVGRR
jgi:hypothetical protein